MTPETPITLTECPRDAMQGISEFIPTDLKVEYLNRLLAVGFEVLDFGSFVSPKAIPQLRDTAEVVPRLNVEDSPTRLLAIVLNERGVADGLAFPQISIFGYPLSISETFQQRNARKSREESVEIMKRMFDKLIAADRQPLVYLSMGFGNPYDDPWDVDLVLEYAETAIQAGAETVMLADTAGDADAATIRKVFEAVQAEFPHMIIGAHFHAHPQKWREKVEAAHQSGCWRFDSALMGYGGCPFAKDDLVGNIATEQLISYIDETNGDLAIDRTALENARALAKNVFERQ